MRKRQASRKHFIMIGRKKLGFVIQISLSSFFNPSFLYKAKQSKARREGFQNGLNSLVMKLVSLSPLSVIINVITRIIIFALSPPFLLILMRNVERQVGRRRKGLVLLKSCGLEGA